MIPTCDVTCIIHDQAGEPEVGAVVTATLDSYVVYQGYVVPERVSAVTNSAGSCTLPLWRNALGAESSAYTVDIVSEHGKKFRVSATVPDVDTANLHEISGAPERA